MPRIVLEDLRKTFPTGDDQVIAAVANVTFAVADREWLTIVGPSGSGKTTLLRLIAGLETPDYGRIRFDDQVVTSHPPQARDVAMVFQSHALFPHFTAFENIAFGLKLRGVARAEIQTRVRETAELLGVLHCLDRPPARLSGGERQRVALGRALIRRPKILLLDEPFAHLDEPLRAQLLVELPALRDRLATTLICVTHNQAEALALGDRVAVLRKGELQQIAPPRDIHAHPANHFVAGFIGSPAMNLWHGKTEQRDGHLVFIWAESETETTRPHFILPLGSWRADWFGANLGRAILLGLRPAAVQLISNPAAAKSGDLSGATVLRGQFAGTQTIYTVAWGGREFTATSTNEIPLQSGQTVAVRFDLAQAHVFAAATGGALF